MTQSMKFVAAFVRPNKLESVVAALQREGIRGLTASETRDYDQTGRTEIFRGTEFTAKFRPMFKIEGAVPTSQIDRMTAIIVAAAQTGQHGDGKILVFDLEHETLISVAGKAQSPSRRAA